MTGLELLTRKELAEMFGISPITVDLWQSQGMPTAGFADEATPSKPGSGAPGARRSWKISRRDLAASWAVHIDTISKWTSKGSAPRLSSVAPRGSLF